MWDNYKTNYDVIKLTVHATYSSETQTVFSHILKIDFGYVIPVDLKLNS